MTRPPFVSLILKLRDMSARPIGEGTRDGNPSDGVMVLPGPLQSYLTK